MGPNCVGQSSPSNLQLQMTPALRPLLPTTKKTDNTHSSSGRNEEPQQPPPRVAITRSSSPPPPPLPPPPLRSYHSTPPLPLPPKRKHHQHLQFELTPPPIVPRVVIEKSPPLPPLDSQSQGSLAESESSNNGVLIDQVDWMYAASHSPSSADFSPPMLDTLASIQEDRSEESTPHDDNTGSTKSCGGPDAPSTIPPASQRSSMDLSVSEAPPHSPKIPHSQLQKLRKIHEKAGTSPVSSITNLSGKSSSPSDWRRLPKFHRHLRKLRRCCRPRLFLSYLFCLLIVILAILGTVFLSLGAVSRDRDFLVAGVILSITCLGMLLHHCLRRSPNNALKSAEDLSIYMPPIPLTPEPGVDPSAPPQPLDTKSTGAESTTHESTCGGDHHHEKSPVTPGSGVPAHPQLRLDIRRQSTVYGDRRTSVYGEPSPLSGGCSRCSLNPPRVLMRPRSHAGRRGSAMMDFARRLSVVGASAPPMSNGWGEAPGMGDRHRFRRCSSHPWEMNRPENPYRE